MLDFANPFALSLIFVAPALIYAYRRRKSEKSQTVSSVLILKTLSKKIAPKKKIKLPLRFYFELLGLIALVFASSLPSSKIKNIAVLFDNSLSMSAKNSQKKSRLDLAIEKFKEEKSIDNSYNIFLSSPELKTSDLAIKTTTESDKLAAAIASLSENPEYEKIWVFTDKKIKTDEDKFKIFTFSESINNLFFENVGLDKNHLISAKISSSINKKLKAKLTLSAIDLSGNLIKILAQQDLNNFGELTFQGDKDYLAYKLELSTDDAISDDNTAWLVASDEISSHVLLVAEQDSGLEQIPGIKITKISFSEYAKLEDYKKYSLIIFHKSAPLKMPQISSLLVLPPDNNNFFPGLGEKNVKISSWNENHPISSYLRADLLKSSKGIEFKTPSWAEAVISGENGSIIAAGQYNGNLAVSSGLELLPYEGRKTPALSILTINIIKWLTNKIGIENITGEKFKLENDAVIIKPNQEVLKLSSGNVINLDLPGIYLISKQGALAVNPIHVKESNTSIVEELVIAKTKPLKSKKDSNWWKYLTMTAMLFLLLEMFLRRFSNEVS